MRLEPLLAEAESYASALDGRLDTIRQVGALPGLFKVGMTQPPAGLATIATEGALWRPDPAGEEALVIPVCDPVSLEPFGPELAVRSIECIDIVAFSPRRPHRWFWRTGRAWALGADNLRRGNARLVETPLAWLSRGGAAACVLNWSSDSPAWPVLRERSFTAPAELRARIAAVIGEAMDGRVA